MLYEPMNPDHVRQTCVLVRVGGVHDVEVWAAKVLLSQELFGELVLDDSEQLALKADISQLRVNWAVTDWSGMLREGQIGVYTHL